MKNDLCKKALYLGLIGSCFFASAGYAAQMLYDQGYASVADQPTPDEQYMLELMNRARANPPAEGAFLTGGTDTGIAALIKTYSVDTSQLIFDFNSYPAAPPFAFNGKLIQVARQHSLYMAINNISDHSEIPSNNGYTGTYPVDRVTAVMPNILAMGENVDLHAPYPLYDHAAFQIDPGEPDLGHRNNIMNLPPSPGAAPGNFNQVGIGVISGVNFGRSGIAVTEDFVTGYQVFVTGVVYNDTNNNGIYDPGEEVGGVSVVPSSGDYYAISSNSGGYSFPVDPNSRASIQVTFSGGPLQQAMTKTVTLTGANVKLDLNPPLPSTVSVAVPDASKNQFVVSRSDASQSLTVNFKLKGTAENGVDYKLVNETISFAVGQLSKTIKLKLLNASIGKTVSIKIKDGAGFTIAVQKATLTIN